MIRRTLLVIATIVSSGLLSISEVDAGNYTVYICNMARRNYQTPVPYTSVFRTGFQHDLFTNSSACLNSIKSRVAENKRYGTDYECFLVIYSDRNPPNGSLALVAGGASGNWQGWIVYWAPARGKGYFLNPYSQFKSYGRSASSANVNSTQFLNAPPSNAASKSPSISPSTQRKPEIPAGLRASAIASSPVTSRRNRDESVE